MPAKAIATASMSSEVEAERFATGGWFSVVKRSVEWMDCLFPFGAVRGARRTWAARSGEIVVEFVFRETASLPGPRGTARTCAKNRPERIHR